MLVARTHVAEVSTNDSDADNVLREPAEAAV